MEVESRTIFFFYDEEEIIYQNLGDSVVNTIKNISEAILELPEDSKGVTMGNLMYQVIGKLAFYPEDEFYILKENAMFYNQDSQNKCICDNISNDNFDDDEYYGSNDDNNFNNYDSCIFGIDPDYSLFW